MNTTTTNPQSGFYSDSAKAVLDGILEQFENGDIPNMISVAMFPTVDSPSAKWSLVNRLQMVMNRTTDARTFKQWQLVGRAVKKGAKAFYILAPNLVKVKNDKNGKTAPVVANGQESESRMVLRGFRAMPVFRFQETEGKALIDHSFTEQSLPLLTRAKEWGLTVEAIPGNEKCYGYFSQEANYIGLATAEESVFFHELAHAAHRRLVGQLKPGQDAIQEIVAELSAAVLCRMVGKECGGHLGNSYRYIEREADKLNLSPHRACMTVLRETQLVLDMILHGDAAQSFIPAEEDAAGSVNELIALAA